ncbi:IS3 family transposase [Rothia sp. 88186D007BW]
MGNFFSHLKSEIYYGESSANVEDWCQVVDKYICWYNNGRGKKRFKGLAPLEHRSHVLNILAA